MDLTETQRAELDPAMVLVWDALNAKKAGDIETYYELMRTVPLPAQVLMILKQCGSANFIWSEGLNTSLADPEYGPGWLDRED